MAASPVSSHRPVGGELNGGHVCGLFDGADDAYAQLTSFVAEGLQRGQRAVHVVDPGQRDDHLRRLTAASIDVEAAMRRRQLEVKTWPDFYVVDGRFEPDRTVGLLKAVLDEGRELGYAGTRAIGFMEWAAERARELDDITTYEALVDVALRNVSDSVVCAYDLRRHRPGVIVDVLALHPYALIEGQLREWPVRRDPRGRILATAVRLFHRHGIAATGIDRVIAEAGVAKATFYRHYPSKEDLVLAWLRDPATRWFDRVFGRAQQKASSPQMVLPAIFDEVAEWLERDAYRGCPYLNTISELADADPDHRILAVARSYLAEIRQALRSAAVSAGTDGAVGDQVHALLAGGIGLAAASRSPAPIHAARDAAVELVS